MTATSLLEWIVARRRVRIPAPDVSAELGGSAVADPLAELIADGLVEAWDDDGVPTLTLTGLASERHELRMNDDLTEWVGPAVVLPPPRREMDSRITLEIDMNGHGEEAALDDLADARQKVASEVAEEAERVEQQVIEIDVARREREILIHYGRRHPCWGGPVRDGFPHPVIILTGVSMWPTPGMWRIRQGGPEKDGGIYWPNLPLRGHETFTGPCAVCKGLPLSPAMACAACGRSGMDHLLPAAQQIRTVTAFQHDPEGLMGGAGEVSKPRKGGKSSRKKQRAARVSRKESA